MNVHTPGRTPWILAGMIACSLALGGCASGGGKETAAAKPTTFAFWPQAPNEPHVQFLKAYSGSDDVAAPKNDSISRIVFGAESEGSQGIQKPYGVAVRNGRVYVCDMRGPSLTVLDLAKKQTRLVGVTGINRLTHPVDVAIADDGMIYVADNQRGGVIVYDAKERYSKVIGKPGMKPVSVALHANRMYVADMASQTVLIFDRQSGSSLGTIGAVGDADGEFRLPLGVQTDKNGNVYVVDMMRCRVQKFGPDGVLISAFGELGDYPGSFARPKHLTVDSEGNIYVVDAAFQNIQVFNDKHQLLMAFGAAGDFPGAMSLPVGVCTSDEGLEYFKDYIHPGFDAKRLIVVTNQFGPSRVAIYALGSRRETYSLADLTASAAKVATGTGSSDDILKLQSVGSEEPVAPPAKPAEPVGPPTTPEGPPAPETAPSGGGPRG